MHRLLSKLLWKIVPAAVAFLFLSGPGLADDRVPSTHTLEGLVSKWVELEKTISVEKKDWKEDRARLEAEFDLFQKEKLILEEEIRTARASNNDLAEERAALLLKQEALINTLDQTRPYLAEAERGLRKWQKSIPPSLSSSLEPLFARLDKSSELSVSQRLQIIFSLYGEIESLQHDIRVTKEILTTKSGRGREFDIIYIGLARGFCVSGDNGEAGIGRPTQNGWEWKWENGWAGSIRRALDYYNREKSADFIELPLEIDESTKSQ
jgi:Protein of unknown function (DUF3450)